MFERLRDVLPLELMTMLRVSEWIEKVISISRSNIDNIPIWVYFRPHNSTTANC
jgi:hypothetical protein